MNDNQSPAAPKRWERTYWLAAAVLPLVLYSFEALRVSLYPLTRGPNVGVAAQLGLWLAFYAAWMVVPRAIWTASETPRPVASLRLVGRLAALGLALSAVHLMALALILRIMHSPPGWGATHLLGSFGEVWLGRGGVWFLAYAAAAAVILFVRTRESTSPPKRLEVRQNGRIASLPVAEILWARAAGNYTELISTRGVFTLRKTLSEVARDLGPTFVRAHRSALVNGTHVREIRPADYGGGYVAVLEGGCEAPLSRRKYAEFKRALSAIDASAPHGPDAVEGR